MGYEVLAKQIESILFGLYEEFLKLQLTEEEAGTVYSVSEAMKGVSLDEFYKHNLQLINRFVASDAPTRKELLDSLLPYAKAQVYVVSFLALWKSAVLLYGLTNLDLDSGLAGCIALRAFDVLKDAGESMPRFLKD